MKTEKQSRRVLYSPIYFFMQPYYNCTCDSNQLKQNLSVFLFNKVKIKHWIFPYFSFIYVCFFVVFFLLGFSFTDTDNSQDSRGSEGTILFHSTTSTCSRTFRHLFATLHVRWMCRLVPPKSKYFRIRK